MTVELATPPKIVERRSYRKLMDKVVAADGAWLRLSPDEVAPGAPLPHKQGRLWQAAKTRKVKVQTTVQDGELYVRLAMEHA